MSAPLLAPVLCGPQFEKHWIRYLPYWSYQGLIPSWWIVCFDTLICRCYKVAYKIIYLLDLLSHSQTNLFIKIIKLYSSQNPSTNTSSQYWIELLISKLTYGLNCCYYQLSHFNYAVGNVYEVRNCYLFSLSFNMFSKRLFSMIMEYYNRFLSFRSLRCDATDWGLGIVSNCR